MRSEMKVSAVVLAMLLQAAGCSCDAGSEGEDGGLDATTPADASMDGAQPDGGDGSVADGSVDGGEDGSVPQVYRLIHRNAAGGAQSTSERYRMIRTQGRGGAGGTSAGYERRDAVHGGAQP